MNEAQLRLALAVCCEPASLGPLSANDLERVWAQAQAGERGPGVAQRADAFQLGYWQERTLEAGSRFITPADEEWPHSLADLDHVDLPSGVGGAPVGLWLRGNSPTSRAVSIVGSRASTSYGDVVASDLAADLAALGWNVISGGAYGIDAAAHRGALAVDGATTMVSAAGIDVVYPRGNDGLVSRILERGGMVSEYPPGSTPARHRFLARNRLVAALGYGTVIVEAAARSGAKNTVSWALRLSRTVMAVPGPVHSAQSVTPHQLIRDQEATIVVNAEEVVAMLEVPGVCQLIDAEGETRLGDSLSGVQRAILDAFPAGKALTPGEISMLANLDMAAVWANLDALTSGGYVKAGVDGFRLACRLDDRVSKGERARLLVEDERLLP